MSFVFHKIILRCFHHIVSGLKNPLTLMSYVTPVMAVSTAIFSLILDPWHEFKTSNYFNSPWHITRSCLLMLFGGTLAFFMVRIQVQHSLFFKIHLYCFPYRVPFCAVWGWILTKYHQRAILLFDLLMLLSQILIPIFIYSLC